jgi:hypothetical protein
MSAITFPHGYPLHSSVSVSDDESSSYDMLGSSSVVSGGFQMNPLSVHPPRTPHTSIGASMSMPVLSSGGYNGSSSDSIHTEVYRGSSSANQEEDSVSTVALEDVEVVAIGAPGILAGSVSKGRPSRTKVQREDVWREILKGSNGRDKALVCFLIISNKDHTNMCQLTRILLCRKSYSIH